MADDIFNTLAESNAKGSRARQPRAVIKINGEAVDGWIEWTVANNNYYEADTYRVVYSTSRLPDAHDEVWFSNQTQTYIEILAGFPSNPANPDPGELASLIYGRVDQMEYDPIQRTITVTGRDLTAVFIDAISAEDYTNKKASDVVPALAASHGLSSLVTPTKQYIGNYYNTDHVLLTAGHSEWDLLAALARAEGFVTYVNGQILYFGPDDAESNNPIPLVLNCKAPHVVGGPPTGNVEEISFTRNQTVAKGITVTVQAAGAYNPTAKKSYPTAPKAISPGKSSPFGATTNYYFNMPAGTTPDKLALRAEAIYNQIISHEMKLKVRMPADAITSPQSTIQVRGTGTAFDQMYFPMLVTRSMTFDEGFTMDIDAQNTSPNLAPVENIDNEPDVAPVSVTAPKLGFGTDDDDGN